MRISLVLLVNVQPAGGSEICTTLKYRLYLNLHLNPRLSAINMQVYSHHAVYLKAATHYGGYLHPV